MRELYDELLRAWNERDAAAFARLFADDGVSIGFDGSDATGAEIREHLSGVFGDHPTAAYVGNNAHQSLVAERRSEAWRIVLFQNTPAQYHGRPELIEAHTAEIEQVRTGAV